jgi:hypothetical protein
MDLRHITYALKIWLTAVFLVPLLVMIWSLVQDSYREDSVRLLLLFWAFGLGFSVVSALLLWVSIVLLNRSGWSPLVSRILLSVLGLVLSLLPFILLNYGLGNSIRQYFHANRMVVDLYVLVIVAGIWIYRWPSRHCA